MIWTILVLRSKFVEDLKESVAEMDEMEQLRIESELEKQQVAGGARERGEHRDSGVGGEEQGEARIRYNTHTIDTFVS